MNKKELIKFLDENSIMIGLFVFMFGFLGFILYTGMMYQEDKQEKNDYCIGEGYEFANSNMIKEFDKQEFIQCGIDEVIIDMKGVANFNTTLNWIEYKP